MSMTGAEIYAFGPFTLEPEERLFRRSGEVVALPPRAFDLLVALVRRAGRLVTKEDLLRAVWSDAFVEEANLSYTVSLLRKALGDDGEAHAYIETVPKQGYRFVAEVATPSAGTPAADAAPPETAARRPRWPRRGIVAAAALGAVVLAALGVRGLRDRDDAQRRMRLAVLPFEDLGRDPARDYLADGLTEDTIASLGQIDPERLSVVGRTSTMAYKGTRKSLAEIGAELGVDYLVESTVRAEGGRLRITAKLIRARDQVQVWAQTYDREPASVLGLQRELSTAVAQQVQLHLSPERMGTLDRRHTRNPEAYDLYLRGRYAWNQLSPSGTRRAIEFYGRAAELDPDYALAWSGLADAFSSSPINGDAPPLQMRPRAEEAASRAVRAEPALAETQTSLGLFEFWLDWDWRAAEAALREATLLDPGYAVAPRVLGITLSFMGRHAEARPMIARALELDPSATNQALSAQIAFFARDPASAATFARQAIALDPGFWVGHYQLAQALEQAGEPEPARAATATAARLSGGNSKAVSLGGYVAAKAGDADAARAALASLQAASRERYVPPYAAALVHAGLGEADAVFEWLERAFAAHDVHLTLLAVDPKWDPYRADPRFSALLARCGFMDGGAKQ